MATDTLKQTGKSLRTLRNDTTYAVNKRVRNFPLVEKLRDSFDVTRPFHMEFRTYDNNDSVEITFIFTEAFEHEC